MNFFKLNKLKLCKGQEQQQQRGSVAISTIATTTTNKPHVEGGRNNSCIWFYACYEGIKILTEFKNIGKWASLVIETGLKLIFNMVRPSIPATSNYVADDKIWYVNLQWSNRNGWIILSVYSQTTDKKFHVSCRLMSALLI